MLYWPRSSITILLVILNHLDKIVDFRFEIIKCTFHLRTELIYFSLKISNIFTKVLIYHFFTKLMIINFKRLIVTNRIIWGLSIFFKSDLSIYRLLVDPLNFNLALLIDKLEYLFLIVLYAILLHFFLDFRIQWEYLIMKKILS